MAARIYRCVVCDGETAVYAVGEFVETLPKHCDVTMEFARVEGE